MEYFCIMETAGNGMGNAEELAKELRVLVARMGRRGVMTLCSVP